jgi:hypothetical protein
MWTAGNKPARTAVRKSRAGLGHSRPGRASSTSSYVRVAPIADESIHRSETTRWVQAEVARRASHLLRLYMCSGSRALRLTTR